MLDPVNTPEKIKKEIRAEEKRNIQLVGNIIPRQGQTLYQFNPETNELTEATFKNVTFEKADKPTLEPGQVLITPMADKIRKQVDYNENCYYFTALNRKNAWIKVGRIKYGR